MRENIKLESFNKEKYEAGFQAIANETDAGVLEEMIRMAKEGQPIDKLNNMKEGIDVEEVFRVNSIFFTKPYHKQRKILQILVWWSIKQYLKTLFKRN